MTMRGTIPIEFMLAVLAITIEPDIDQTILMNDLEISVDIAIAARHFLETGQIVTEDGEILLQLERNPDENIENPAIEPSDSDWETNLRIEVESIWTLFKRTFPDHVGPDEEMEAQLLEAADNDKHLIADVVLILEMSDKPVHTPPTLTLWMLKNKSHNNLREQAEILRRTKAKNANTLITRTLRESEEKIKRAPPLGASPERVSQLSSLKEKLRG